MKKKPARKSAAPVCVFCRRSAGVSFAMFSPRFAPFGTACTECESTLPPGTVVPSPVPADAPAAAVKGEA
jgi:hypothetical protein